MHDSNAARAKVAENYLKSTTGLWIVAPINRAVDDKAAKSLLGESFKKQLQMDGGFSSVTFICSKTDDISVMEAQDSLGLGEEIGTLELEAAAHRKENKKLEEKIEELKNSKSDYRAASESAMNDLETWECLKDDCEDGKVVFDPASGKKRGRGCHKLQKSRKKRRNSETESEASGAEQSATNSDNEEEDIHPQRSSHSL